MKGKHIVTGILTLAVMTASGISAFAEDLNAPARMPGQRQEFFMNRGMELTEEQKAEMEGKRTEMEKQRAEIKAKAEAANRKWESLTAAQKEEIYRINEKDLDAKIELIDKYVEYGIIDSTEAEKLKEGITKIKSEIRSGGKLPMFGERENIGAPRPPAQQ